ncbi:NAD(P)-dependent oxidoreductase [Polynucleobacter sp. AP-Sving-400A-A2]|uniref:NAD(P)-dependent oxidoreductase n=1 Tax=Polynucleobacter sp. AP-Sving-400A-A2 TaxID=2081049 RepID=UPI001BFE0622|nr:NAD(P)-dependent oxidoreductase [Polynucleobacter sp. AP-Sving-400A-A2]QWE15392.1 NAD(P)-dependent oxidoreductase [Polynucleobacter sp. AP-Sving-400A-A2]
MSIKISDPLIGFIGVGNMGNPMAANLLKAGYRVSVFDREPHKALNLVSLGANLAENITQLGRQSQVVICSLPGPAQVKEVMFGSGGLIDAIKPDSTIIDTSTSSVELAQELSILLEQKNVGFLEAPVTNAVDFAVLGKLSIFVAGKQSNFEKYKPIFEVLGEKIFYVGKSGNGATIKLLTNLLWFTHAAVIGEALMLGAKADIPLEIVAEAIQSSAGNSWVAEHDIPSIFAGHYDPSFSLALCCKDLDLVNQIAQSQGFTLTMGQFVQSLFEEAQKKYGASAAELHVVKLLEDRVGTYLRPHLQNLIP